MKNIRIAQLTSIILVSGLLAGMFVFTPVYEEVHSRIVSVLCLSCIKLDPKTGANFTFQTANGKPHPSFVVKNLTKGPVFLHYTEDVCHACDIMLPIIQHYFNVTFTKEEYFSKTVQINNTNITFIYINIDHVSKELRDTLDIYDKDNISGLPMFSLITLNYDRGIVKPFFRVIRENMGSPEILSLS